MVTKPAGAPMADHLNPEALDRMREAVAEVISETTYTCSRVWEAWHYGTMTDEDFSPAWEDGVLLTEVVQAVLAALPAPRTVTTVEELDAMPAETVIKAADGNVYEQNTLDPRLSVQWVATGSKYPVVPECVELPALVLWVPTEGGGE